MSLVRTSILALSGFSYSQPPGEAGRPVRHRPASALALPLAVFTDAVTRTKRIEQRNIRVFQLGGAGNPERAVDPFVRESFAMTELQAEGLTKDLVGVSMRIASVRHLIA